MIVEPDFLTHWKTEMLIDELGGDAAAPLYVIALWAHCQQRRSDTFSNLAPNALKAICRYKGEASKLASALERCGFIEVDGTAYVVHGWAEINAKLMANWANGQRGGRPPKHKENPTPISVNPNGTDRVEKSREEKIKKESKPKKEAFQPPTVEEVRTYCLERSNGIDPDAFLAHYEANGWVQGKGKGRPIKDWRAAVRTWEANRKATSNGPTTRHTVDLSDNDL